MNVVSIVANLVKERDYYQESMKECQAIIKQLTEGSGEIEYIHPLDLNDVLLSTSSFEVVDVSMNRDERIITIGKTGKKYKQSPFIPARTKAVR